MQYQENRAVEAREMIADMAILLLTIVAIGIVMALVMGWLQG